MATFFYDPQYPAYTAVPTWLAAQDGDGVSKDLAIPAVASITVSGVCSVGHTITIMGVTLTAAATVSSASQFAVGTNASTQADAIATAINLSTANVNSTTTPTQPQVRDLLYARSPATGAPANTVEIMTRVGTAKWNTSSLGSTSSGVLAMGVWSGGLGGSIGYLSNNTTIWKSGKTKTTYGLLFGQAATSGNFAGIAMTADADVCYIRANNNKVEININDIRFQARGKFIVDNGTVWPGDTGTFTIEKNTTSGASPCLLSSWGGGVLIFSSLDQSRAIINMTSGAGAEQLQLSSNVTNANSSLWQIDNFTITDNNPSSGNIIFGSSYRSVPQQAIAFTRIKFTCVKNQYTLFQLGGGRVSSLQGGVYKVSSFIANFPNFVGTGTYLADISMIAPGGSPGTQIILEDITYTASPSAIPPYIIGETAISPGYMPYGANAIVRNIKGCKPANNVGLLGTAVKAGLYSNTTSILQQNVGVTDTRYFKLETNAFVKEVSASSGIPTLASSYPSGEDVGAYFDWPGSNLPIAVHPLGVNVVEATVVVTSSGLTTVNMYFLIESGLVGVLTKAQIQMQVTYVGSDGICVTTPLDINSTTVHQTGEEIATWDKKTYTTYVPCKMSAVLPSIKINTEIDVAIVLLASNPLPTGGVTRIVYDPSIEVV